MTKEEIEQKALDLYPIKREYTSFGLEEDANREKRNVFVFGFTKGLTANWISTKERLPEPTAVSRKTYLCKDDKGNYYVMARNVDGWSCPSRWCDTYVITHWMEIPDLE